MSLHNAAKYLESKGRGNDTMLVHMTPREVKGLQELALASGGSLTVNPNTGLVEAGWLDKLLPTIAGIGLSFIPGVGPWAAAGIVGGAETLRTGDLGKGLLAGLGAYGGAGMMQGLSQAGAETLASNAGTGASGTASTAGGGYSATIPAGGTDAAVANTATTAGATPTSSTFGSSVNANFPGTTPTPTIGANAVPTPSMAGQAPVNFTNVKAGFGDVGRAWELAPKGTGLGMGSAVVNAATPEMPTPEDEKLDPRYKKAPYSMYLSPNYKSINPLPTPNYYRPTGYAEGGIAQASPQTDYFPQSQVNPAQYATPTQVPGSREVINADFDAAVNPYNGNPKMMASGGIARFRNEGMVAPAVMRMGQGIARDTDEETASLNAFDAAKKRLKKQFAAANLTSANLPKTNVSRLGEIKTGIAAAAGGQLGSYSDGGRMLKGPGDGMSDSIPASIGGKQPARLADGEFVVPADVVSHLGNGSTDAGAKKLYGMMDKIRKARTGKKKQAPAVKADKYMPA